MLTWWDFAPLIMYSLFAVWIALIVALAIYLALDAQVVHEDPPQTPEDLFKPLEGGDR